MNTFFFFVGFQLTDSLIWLKQLIAHGRGKGLDICLSHNATVYQTTSEDFSAQFYDTQYIENSV